MSEIKISSAVAERLIVYAVMLSISFQYLTPHSKPLYFSEKELFSVFHDISLNKKLYLTNIMFV